MPPLRERVLALRPTSGAAKAAYAAALINLVAGLAMLAWLQPGLPVPGSVLEHRMAYLREHAIVWRAGWLLWHAAALSLLGFYVGLARRLWDVAPIRAGLALLAGAAGLCADLAAQGVYMGVQPLLEPAGFALAEAASGVLTGYLGNGLYTVAGALLTWAGWRVIPAALRWLGVLVWALGTGLSAASIVHSASGQFWSTALLMPAFVIWVAGMGRWLDAPSRHG